MNTSILGNIGHLTTYKFLGLSSEIKILASVYFVIIKVALYVVVSVVLIFVVITSSAPAPASASIASSAPVILGSVDLVDWEEGWGLTSPRLRRRDRML